MYISYSSAKLEIKIPRGEWNGAFTRSKGKSSDAMQRTECFDFNPNTANTFSPI